MLAKPVIACLALFLLFPVVGKDLSVLSLYSFQCFFILGYVFYQFVNIDFRVVSSFGASE